MKKYVLLSALFLLFLSYFSAETIEFSAGYMSGKTGDSNTTTVLKENAYIKTETIEIFADNIELSGKDFRFIKARGNVDGKNIEAKTDFSCDTLEYDRETEVAILKGNVVFVDTENNVEAQAESIEYDQKNEIAILQINVNMKQEDNVCLGSYCIYYKEKQLLELSGNAQVMQGDDVFRAQHITMNLETEEISLGGNVKGSVTEVKGEENPENKDVNGNEESQSKEQTEESDENKKLEENGEKSLNSDDKEKSGDEKASVEKSDKKDDDKADLVQKDSINKE